eukprot:745868-Hanusia_phi.AAC.1
MNCFVLPLVLIARRSSRLAMFEGGRYPVGSSARAGMLVVFPGQQKSYMKPLLLLSFAIPSPPHPHRPPGPVTAISCRRAFPRDRLDRTFHAYPPAYTGLGVPVELELGDAATSAAGEKLEEEEESVRVSTGSLLVNHLERGSEEVLPRLLGPAVSHGSGSNPCCPDAAKNLPERREESRGGPCVQAGGLFVESSGPCHRGSERAGAEGLDACAAARVRLKQGDTGMISSLSRFLLSDDARVRRAAIGALQGIIEQDERNLKLANMLLAHLEDPDPSVRTAVVTARASLPTSLRFLVLTD